MSCTVSITYKPVLTLIQRFEIKNINHETPTRCVYYGDSIRVFFTIYIFNVTREPSTFNVTLNGAKENNLFYSD